MSARADTKPMAGVEVNVRAVIGHDERLLLVRQRGAEHWFLPGGHVEPGEPAEMALRREIREELDATVLFTTFLAVVEHGYRDAADVAHHELNLVFDVTLADTNVRTMEDHLKARWVRRVGFDRAAPAWIASGAAVRTLRSRRPVATVGGRACAPLSSSTSLLG